MKPLAAVAPEVALAPDLIFTAREQVEKMLVEGIRVGEDVPLQR